MVPGGPTKGVRTKAEPICECARVHKYTIWEHDARQLEPSANCKFAKVAKVAHLKRALPQHMKYEREGQ